MTDFNPSVYVNQQISTYFTMSPASGPSKCSHLPMAILGEQSADQVEALIGKCSSALTKKYATLKSVTLLHLSALVGNSEVLKALCPEKLSKQPLDNEKNTPLHLRAITAQSEKLSEDAWIKEYLSTCLTPEATRKTKNSQKATPGKIFTLAHSYEATMKKPVDEYEGIISSNKKAETKMVRLNEHVEIQDSCLERGYRFIEEMVATPKTMIDQWLFSDTFCVSETTKKSKKNTPKVVIREVPGKGCATFAGAKIPKGFAIEYLGQMLTADSREEYLEKNSVESGFDLHMDSAPYLFLNPDEARNVAPFIADGLPNVKQEQGCNIDGLKRRLYITAQKNIKKGEELAFNYGPNHPIKYGSYVIQDYKAIQTFFKKVRLEDMFDQMKGAAIFSDQHKFFSMVYLLETPTVLFKLAGDGTFPLKQIEATIQAFEAAPAELINMFPKTTSLVLDIVKSISSARNKFSAMGEAKTFDRIMKTAIENAGQATLKVAKKLSKENDENISLNDRKMAYTTAFALPFRNLHKHLDKGISAQKAERTFNMDFLPKA